MSDRREVTKLLRLLAQAIEDLTDVEYDEILNGKARMEFLTSGKKGKEGLKESSKVSTDDLQLLADHLRESNTREEARSLLNKDPRVPLRDNLEQLARLLKVHVNKHDKRDAIENKIIESAIGVRLRSQAIQGLNLKGSGRSKET